MSDTTYGNVATFDTRPDMAIPRESPLSVAYHRGSVPAPSRDGQVLLEEKPFLGHLILRGGAIVLDEALREVLGINLPGRPLGLALDESGECSVQWMSPDEWLVIVPGGEEFELENRLRSKLGEAHFAIVNVSGGQTLVELSGEKARDVLMKSVPYDVHPQNFPVGKAVSTVFAKASAILRRPAEDRWELVLRRSFADYGYRWLLDAGEEFGIGVKR
ncbi:sarcosine oxidase subunit gamma [Modicisalibacter ilicicola DSM 19980]|uniref:Sarcosine oxidase subunit gamma n=1 Tax=Modicisalibacter ilicicola DSM 19980 TaxID=1121942 RepID=A0A1M4WG55_9GAMM|nr:sarcosine oxidase subunit gamma family protein [Halomonas ilicicola]SHE80167.1 sarcosine oxidase subunit gamma [Halomonas ilicicola DSM 19980]